MGLTDARISLPRGRFDRSDRAATAAVVFQSWEAASVVQDGALDPTERASRSGRDPTWWETIVKLHPAILWDSAVRAQVSRSTGRSSPAPDGGFGDPDGRPVGGAHKTPRRVN